MSQLYGYVRVSTREQNEARQIIALHQFCVPDERIYLDKQSGKDFNRPAYKRLLRTLRPGDVLAVSRSTVWAGTMRKFWSNGGC